MRSQSSSTCSSRCVRETACVFGKGFNGSFAGSFRDLTNMLKHGRLSVRGKTLVSLWSFARIPVGSPLVMGVV